MRIWSLHPKYLDSKGLVALWRETLLAKHVLEGKTKGYKNHPQLDRFKNSGNAISAINHYLKVVYAEASNRSYRFDQTKFSSRYKPKKLFVTRGQVQYEFEHLLRKLKARDKKKYKEIKLVTEVEIHPLFKLIKGDIESWEVVSYAFLVFFFINLTFASAKSSLTLNFTILATSP